MIPPQFAIEWWILPARSSLEEAIRGELLPGSIFRDSLQHRETWISVTSGYFGPDSFIQPLSDASVELYPMVLQ